MPALIPGCARRHWPDLQQVTMAIMATLTANRACSASTTNMPATTFAERLLNASRPGRTLQPGGQANDDEAHGVRAHGDVEECCARVIAFVAPMATAAASAKSEQGRAVIHHPADTRCERLSPRLIVDSLRRNESPRLAAAPRCLVAPARPADSSGISGCSASAMPCESVSQGRPQAAESQLPLSRRRSPCASPRTSSAAHQRDSSSPWISCPVQDGHRLAHMVCSSASTPGCRWS